MLRKTMWKIAAAVLAVVIAGIVYCIFFTEEQVGTVQYQTNEEGTSDDYVNTPVDNAGAEVQTNSPPLIYVHVCGAVKKPAVYSLPDGSRVCDVIAKAGGLTEGAADDYVNQARFLSDGERVYIPKMDELSDLSVSQYAAGQSPNQSGVHMGEPVNPTVNINTAGISELTGLPGIGESRAKSIIEYREKHGTFSKIEDIMKISGIKGAAYEKIKDRICTGNE